MPPLPDRKRAVSALVTAACLARIGARSAKVSLRGAIRAANKDLTSITASANGVELSLEPVSKLRMWARSEGIGEIPNPAVWSIAPMAPNSHVVGRARFARKVRLGHFANRARVHPYVLRVDGRLVGETLTWFDHDLRTVRSGIWLTEGELDGAQSAVLALMLRAISRDYPLWRRISLNLSAADCESKAAAAAFGFRSEGWAPPLAGLHSPAVAGNDRELWTLLS